MSRKIKGRAYLFKKNKSVPECSADIVAEHGKEYLVAAHKLLEKYRIEFVSDDPKLRD